MSEPGWTLRTLIPDAVAARRGEVRWTFLEVPGMYLREYRDTMFWSAFPEEPAALLERAAGEPGVVASVPFTLRRADYFSDQAACGGRGLLRRGCRRVSAAVLATGSLPLTVRLRGTVRDAGRVTPDPFLRPESPDDYADFTSIFEAEL